MKKHRVVINMTNNFLAFWSDHCIHIGAISSAIPSISGLPIEIAAVRIEKNITPQKSIKKGIKQDIKDFLQIPNKLNCKKRRHIFKSKQKASFG